MCKYLESIFTYPGWKIYKYIAGFQYSVSGLLKTLGFTYRANIPSGFLILYFELNVFFILIQIKI